MHRPQEITGPLPHDYTENEGYQVNKGNNANTFLSNKTADLNLPSRYSGHF